MIFYTIFITIILSVFSTAVLSYISMAVSLGPWVEPTIVLLATLLFCCMRSTPQKTKALTLVTAGASVGGILAIGCGFAFPTLYFLNPELFNSWLSSPFYFITLLASLAFFSGALGFLIANYYEEKLLVIDQLAFPIGQMSYKMVAAQNQIFKALQLCISFCATLLYSIALTVFNAIPKTVCLLRSCTFAWCTIPALKLVMLELPMLWSIGFVTGHVIAVPMLFGILAKIFICMPAYNHYFSHLKQEEFFLAFCSGLILYGCILGFLELRKSVKNFFKVLYPSIRSSLLTLRRTLRMSASKCNADADVEMRVHPECPASLRQERSWMYRRISANGLLILAPLIALLFHFNFSIPAQLYLIIFTIICTYQLLIIGGKVGIAPMPRFATFVMVPGILLFGFTGVQATIVSTFVEVCGGVAVDVLFGRKMGYMADVDKKQLKCFQWLGLVISSISVGVVFWLLITHFGLGSEQLFAQRAQTRALLITVSSFDFFALILGALFAAFLKELKVNATLVLGGILMPLDYALLLTLGGLSSYLVRDKEAQYPFWSGMFAASSLWMIVRALI